MDPKQLHQYLALLDWPAQLSPHPHPTSLFLLQARHLMTLPYQSRYYQVTPSSQSPAGTCTTATTSLAPPWQSETCSPACLPGR